jgi:hypothetical protein
MPKQSLETLEIKQKIYLRMIVQMQKDLAKVTKGIQSLRAKPVAAKTTTTKKAIKKVAVKKPGVKNASAKTKGTGGRGRPAKAK